MRIGGNNARVKVWGKTQIFRCCTRKFISRSSCKALGRESTDRVDPWLWRQWHWWESQKLRDWFRDQWINCPSPYQCSMLLDSATRKSLREECNLSTSIRKKRVLGAQAYTSKRRILIEVLPVPNAIPNRVMHVFILPNPFVVCSCMYAYL